MKLYNKTRYPGVLLEKLLVEAGKAVGARTSGVVVIATSAKPGYVHCHGIASRADYVRRFALGARAYKKGGVELKEGEVETDGGYFKITLPYPFVPDWIKRDVIHPAWRKAHCFDGLHLTELIFSVASHEWRHIEQYQERAFDFRDRRERAKNHDNRVWERDAIKASGKAGSKPKNKAQEAILSLALWIEETNNGD